MMQELSRKLGEMEYDGLITDLTPPTQVGAGTIAKLDAEAVYKRGTVLAKSAKDGKLRILGTTPPTPESGQTADVYTPDCILCDDTQVGTTDDVTVCVYTAGCFDPEKLAAAKDYTLTEADKDKLRGYSNVLKAASK